MRMRYVPGVCLLICAAPLLGWIAQKYGVLWLVFSVFALVVMFRRPVLYSARRALGLPEMLLTELYIDPAKDSA